MERDTKSLVHELLSRTVSHPLHELYSQNPTDLSGDVINVLFSFVSARTTQTVKRREIKKKLPNKLGFFLWTATVVA